MGEIRKTVIAHAGRLVLEDDAFLEGESFEVVAVGSELPKLGKTGTIGDLLRSEAVGIWADRDDIGDSVEYARKLRKDLEENLRGR